MFKPLISKYARQLPCDCAETDLIIAMLEFIRDLDAVLVSYITPMLRNKKIDIYRNVASKNLVVVNVDYDLCEFRNYDIDERIDCMNCLNQLSDKQRNILIRRFKCIMYP
jgi:DNA-directed RNA polymerase specialized sigma24 family protein